ncbi:protein NLP4 isoform X1 [Senna tora]|uniref:Protein NLP4 isoform X1 n=1 Tax=Senna tora TaxID=362788 RepID=A0A834U014_9FABA|nr:protein NLP4 isoform X1 [Senna tora]
MAASSYLILLSLPTAKILSWEHVAAHISIMGVGDGITTPDATLEIPPESSITMDFDYMDQLFADGCWLETAMTTASDSLLLNSTPLFDYPFSWPPEAALDMNQNSEEVRRWWIGPTPSPSMGNPGPASSSVRDRLVRALIYMKGLKREKDEAHALIQIWVPVKRGGRRILTTSDVPFWLETRCPNLAKYREISEKYEFSGEEGLPGRVYVGKVPEWTPDVRLFTSDEYPRVEHAQHCDVRGSLALPIFEQGSSSTTSTCLGVIELVMTNHQINYTSQLQTLCKALQAVDLRSCSSMQTVKKGCNKWYEGAIPEIAEVLRCACETHQLPLAQAWVPCIQQDKEGCRHSDDNYLHCISPVEQACYVGDKRVQGFHEACCEHHLLRGQGIAGEAFLTNHPCFSPDITSLPKTQYPLSHHARMFNLKAAVAIRLRSIHCAVANKHDFVLEFFLPHCDQHKNMLASLSTIIQTLCRSFRVITHQELEQETNLLVGDSSRRHQLEADQLEFPAGGESSLSSAGISKVGERRRAKSDKTITLQDLQQHFPGSLKDAAKNIGVCTTTLKRICRQHGIKRWPSHSFYSNFPKLASPNLSTGMPQNPSTTQPESKSPTTSCSESSISSHSCSSASEQQPQTRKVDGALKRVRSEAELKWLSEDKAKVLPRSQSHKALGFGNNLKTAQKEDGMAHSHSHRVKITYGDEKARFRMPKNWGYTHLLQEIAKRFNINDITNFYIKYLDDDSDWVLLTCDADLEECIYIAQSSATATIKLSLHHSMRTSPAPS